MSRLKIGLFIDSFFPSIDGVVMVVDNYARRLAKTCDVVVVAPEPYDKKYIDNFPYKVIRIKSIKLPKSVGAFVLPLPKLEIGLNHKLLKEKFDIIHIHSPFPIGRLGLEIGEKLDVPVIATMHTQFHLEFMRRTKSKKINKLLLENIMRVFNECNECWAVNEKIADVFVGYGYNRKPLVARNGTDMILLNEKDARKNINNKYNIKNNEFVLLFVGRINILKNILFIAEALKYLKKLKIKYKMMFVGSGPDDKILMDKVKQCEVENEVIMTGEITDRNLLAQIYNRADLFVFPSLFDASSLVQVEAASQKTPTIFIDGAATACTIKKDHNGFTAPNDPELFAIEIRNILKNKKLYNEVSENAYTEVYKSWDMLTNETYERYIEIIKKES